jgi:hypothetical protein
MQYNIDYDFEGKMPNKWIHINANVGDPWILPIWAAVNDAESSGKAFPIPKEVKSQLGLSISTRLDMLPRIVHRINDKVNKIYKATDVNRLAVSDELPGV